MAARPVLPVDAPRARPDEEVRDRGELDGIVAALPHERHVLELVDRLAIPVLELETHLDLAFVGPEPAQVDAAHGGRDDLRDLLRREALLARAIPVDDDLDLLPPDLRLRPDVLEARGPATSSRRRPCAISMRSALDLPMSWMRTGVPWPPWFRKSNDGFAMASFGRSLRIASSTSFIDFFAARPLTRLIVDIA